ncbi:MAG: hypothetical protein ACYC0V_02695 [Armatimonadota bacterium]
MENLEINSGNSTLAFQEFNGYYIPSLYLEVDDEKKKVLEGNDFLKLCIGDKKYSGRVRKVFTNDKISFTGDFPEVKDLAFSGEVTPTGDLAPRFEWIIKIAQSGDDVIECRVEIDFAVRDSGVPRWMIPAMFYKDNRHKDCIRKYPRFAIDTTNTDEFTSDFWAFRSDRSSCPSVLCWTDNYTSALATPEAFDDTISGLGFKADQSGTNIMLYFPYIEAPVKYSFCKENGIAPEYTTTSLIYHGELSISFSTYIEERDLHLYDSLIRDIYNDLADETNPWMTKASASSLLAYGLHRWHYDKENSILCETSAFDGYFGKGSGQFDRQHMHVAWVSGIPYAYALWKYGVETSNAAYIDAGLSVIDKVANEGVSPCGFFYSQWTKESGWGTGWNPKPEWLQACTTSEATWFLIQSIEYGKSQGVIKPAWESAIRRNIDTAINIQREDGNMGSYYNISSGAVEEWDGAAGIMWIPAFLSAWRLFNDNRYLDAAVKAGNYYSKFVEDEYIYGAPEDVHLTPTSEDGYNTLIAYVHLYEAAKEEKWLDLAESAADWMLSFRWTYNTRFSEYSMLGKYDYRTMGADNASPANNHLHNYGLICHPELLRLWQYTGDTYYLGRAVDNLACFHQFIARNDADFNARTGMITEQLYHTDWTHPKGSMLQLAHSWCAGMILYANLYTKEFGDIIIDSDNREVYILDSISIKATEDLDPDLVLTLVNPSVSEQTLTIRHSKLGVEGSIKMEPLEECRVLIGGLESKVEFLEDEMWTE